jgi:hypothetical protein
MDIEELPSGAMAMRAARRAHAGGNWWN